MPEIKVLLDLNNPEFQKALFGLDKQDQYATLMTLKKISGMTWEQVYKDQGLKWELILSKLGPNGKRLYTLRATKRMRVLALRDGAWMRLLYVHPDHDDAYKAS